MRAPIARGEGPVWVMVHGSASDASTWAGLVARTEDRRLVMYDRLGYERRSPKPAGLSAQIGQLDEVVSSCSEAPLVIGASYGAVVALEWARDASTRPRGLVLVEPPLPEDPEDPPRPHAFFAGMEQRRATDPEAAGRYFLQQVLNPDAWAAMPELFRRRAAQTIEGISGDCRALMDHVPDFEGLRSFDLPTLLVGGGRSLVSYGRTLDALEARLPRASRALIPDAGHMAYSDAPDAFLDAVRRFEATLSSED